MVSGLGFGVSGLAIDDGLVGAKRLFARIQGSNFGKWLKQRPKYGHDWLMCSEFAMHAASPRLCRICSNTPTTGLLCSRQTANSPPLDINPPTLDFRRPPGKNAPPLVQTCKTRKVHEGGGLLEDGVIPDRVRFPATVGYNTPFPWYRRARCVKSAREGRYCRMVASEEGLTGRLSQWRERCKARLDRESARER